YVDPSGPGEANEDYDAPDYQNLLPALQNPTTGATPIPSLHRPALVNYWFHRLPTILGAGSVFAGASDTNQQTWFTDPTATIAGTSLPQSEQQQITALKRRILLRPSHEDHPHFTGSNPTSIGTSATFYSLWDGFSNSIPFDKNLNGTIDPDEEIQCFWDVDNDGDGTADSIWVDVGFPVRSTADGRLYKPLVAILCVDLDSRLNLNAHGAATQVDMAGYASSTSLSSHGSIVPSASGTPTSTLNVPRGQGVGPAEVNLAAVLGDASDGTTAAQQYYNLLADRYNSNDGDPTNDAPGVAGGDPLSVNKRFDMPTIYDPATIGGTMSHGTPTDLTGGLAVGLDLRGQPLYAPLSPAGPQNVNGSGLTATDNPYELNLSGAARGVATPASPNWPPDAPFTPAEFEALARPYDVDAGDLPDRLAALVPSIVENRRWREVTTESWDLPTPAVALPPELRYDDTGATTWDSAAMLPGRRVSNVVDLLRAKLQKANSASLDEPALNAAVAAMLPPETIAGLRMDLNRPFGNGQDGNDNRVIDEPGESDTSYQQVDALGNNATKNTLDPDNDGSPGAAYDTSERQLYARHLYVLMLTLMNYDPAVANAATQARQAAQWAVNVVDFRDRDAIMTPFEYDENPFDGNWDADGDVSVVNANCGVVWGCERPELLISETLAFHDRRTEDTAEEPNGRRTTDNPPDDDFDQKRRPQGSLFVELHNPWTDNEPKPGEFYSALGGAGGIELDKLVGGTPVWRLVVINDPGDFDKDPDDPVSTSKPTIARAAYFVNGSASLPTDGGIQYYRNGAINPIAPIKPGRYAVIGPNDESDDGIATTYIGRCPLTNDTSSTRRIVLQPSSDPDQPGQVTVYADGKNNSLSQWNMTTDDIQPPTAILLGGLGRLSISEPANPANRYPENDAMGAPGSYNSTTDTFIYQTPWDTPFDKEPRTGEIPEDAWNAWLKDNGVHPRVAVVHLQRLANPLLPYDAVTNPYRTIDSMPIDLTTFNGATGASDPGTASLADAFFSRERGENEEGRKPTTIPLVPGTPTDETNNLWTQLPSTTNEPPNTPYPLALDPTAASHHYNKDFACTLGFLNEGFHYLPTPPGWGGPVPNPPAPPKWWKKTMVPDAYVGSPRKPFPWLTWLNRPFVSAGELLLAPRARSSQLLGLDDNDQQVYCFPLTSASIDPYRNAAEPYGHLGPCFLDDAAPTDAPNGKLHRLLDFVRASSPFVGTELQGDPAVFTESGANNHSFHPPFNRISNYRDPGRININMIASPSVFYGLMNQWQPGTNPPQPTAGVQALWNNVVASRRGYGGTSGADLFALDTDATPLPTRFANPFRSFAGRYLVPDADVQTAVGDQEINATLLRPAPNGSGGFTQDPLFRYASTDPASETDRNPAFRYQPFARLENLVTTRSNVYAVWITVGYFEVEPWQETTPGSGVNDQNLTRDEFLAIHPDGYRLGHELGSDSGEVERHRSFSILDRTIPVGFRRGEDLNVDKAILLRRFIE
ncbi:MAG: hypothetical protein JW719_02700, partial [Pirellulales bacterium]|nr:hypothetical protein [Pirellulales bacterium]